MINASNLQSELSRRLGKMAVGDTISVRTWKNDRSITIRCTAPDIFSLAEDGFYNTSSDSLDKAGLLKALKPIAKREFPRSNKLRLIQSKE